MDAGGARELRHPLVEARLEHGWSQTELARRLRQLGALQGVNVGTTVGTVSRWEHGRQAPDGETQTLLGSLFGVPDHERAQAPWPQWLPVERPHVCVPWTVGNTTQVLDAANRSGSVDRRQFVTLTGVSLSPLLVGWLTADPEAAYAVENGRRISTGLIDRIDGRILELQHADDEFGGGDLLGETDALLATTTRLIRTCTYTQPQAQRLYRAAADLSRMAGWGRFDAGLHAAAQTRFHAALRAAETAGDRLLSANVFAFMAIQSYSTGHARDADDLIRTAQAGVRGRSTPVIDAMLLARQGRALAKAGDAPASYRALNRASELVGDGPGPDDPAWAYWVELSDILMLTGSSMLDLGDPQGAERVFRQADDVYGPTYQRSRIMYLSRMTTALVDQGDVEHACDYANRALGLLDHVNSERSTDHVRENVAQLRRHAAVSDVADYLDRARPAVRTASPPIA